MSCLKKIDSYEVPNLCVECGMDLGSENPRQYCRKTWCPRLFDVKEVSENDNVHEVPSISPKKRRIEIEKDINKKSEKIKELASNIDDLEKDLIALKKALENN